MRLRQRIAWLGLGLFASAAVAVQGQKASAPNAELAAIADEAYVYGYPLVLLDQTEQQTTNVYKAEEQAAPLNQFARQSRLPDATFKAVVRPNVDTLYASAFLDLSDEPIVLHVPDMKGRYYLMPMYDAYTNVFASPGKRTTGTRAHDFAIVGPRWKGRLPAGMTRIQAPTNTVWILGRTEVKGRDDLPAVVDLTQQYTLTPLSSFGRPYSPPINSTIDASIPALAVKPPDVVAQLDDRSYFERLAQLLRDNPPPARDKAALARFARIGLSPGHFRPSPAAERAIAGAGQRAGRKIARMDRVGQDEHGWRVSTRIGTYGTRYLLRAQIAAVGLGANIPQDAIYPVAFVDTRGHPLRGEYRYFLHFTREQVPPVRAFWSITLYDKDGYLVDNPLNRYDLGSRDALVRHSDGSFDILIQEKSPGGKMAANWLPAPHGSFNLTLRLYWPERPVIDGHWKPVGVQQQRPMQIGTAANPQGRG